jgi:thioredoxin-related protein
MMNYINTMKKLLVLSLLIITAACSNAQSNKDIEKIPSYRILTTDSEYVTQANLKKHKPVVIIYFAPDCGHCQQLMYELKPKMKQISNAQIVMITFSKDYDIRSIKGFYRDFGLSSYPNITVGTEGYTYQVQRYFDVKNTPYIAIYNHNGKLAKTFAKVPKDVNEVVAAIKKA